MNQERKTPKFQGIADSMCRCTTAEVCARCRTRGRYGGKFGTSWDDAVKRNNVEIKNEGGDGP